MAKYNVDHACGHSQTHQLVGPHKERDRKLAWLADQPCSECYQARLQADREAAAAAAIETAVEVGLVALQGSPKQVDWAARIRENVRREVEKLLSRLSDKAAGDAAKLAAVDARRRIITAALNSQPAASWWIDRREVHWSNLVMGLVSPEQLSELREIEAISRA